MTSENGPVTIVVPGDLHLTTRDQPNYEAAFKVVTEINELIRPDFVQFIGDNVQDGEASQFHLFNELADMLAVRHFALVGDHDIGGDANATFFRQWVGEPCGSVALHKFRFVRLNTLEVPRLGFSDRQLQWLSEEFEITQQLRQQVVLFQHHYPYKVCDDYSGPGINRWRKLVEAYRPIAIICGHTHYGQIANNGRSVSIATRSIGDPEGGTSGYQVIHVENDDFATTYRTVEDDGPLVLITHPRDLLLATEGRHIVQGDDVVRVRTWSRVPVCLVTGSIDEGPWFELQTAGHDHWATLLLGSRLDKGEHTLRVAVRTSDGEQSSRQIRFFVDPTGRYTAVPSAQPIVRTTAFC